jgi:excisionase family DNA binding protein
VNGRLLTAREVGEWLGLSTEAVLRRWRRGEIPGYRIDRNVLRFDRDELLAWLESTRGASTTAPVRSTHATTEA